jgi:hypothetical protein
VISSTVTESDVKGIHLFNIAGNIILLTLYSLAVATPTGSKDKFAYAVIIEKSLIVAESGAVQGSLVDLLVYPYHLFKYRPYIAHIYTLTDK